jgi:IS5 family transposase
MERELWPLLYRHLQEAANGFSQKYVHYQPWVLIAVFLWAALHDRPVCWACQGRNWATTSLRPPRLPSAATMSRRIDRVGVGLLWRRLEERLRGDGHPARVAFLDGKPLVISGVSKDPDAGYGRAAGGYAKGYKLHTVWSNRPLPEAWEVTPMNTCEKAVARRLIGQLDYGGYLLADGNYDASDLYDRAWRQGYQLVAAHRKGKNPGRGHHYQSPHRRRSIALLHSPFGRALYRLRGRVERSFGNAVSFGGGLSSLPAWVRGLDRVRTWVWAKLLINAVRILKKQGLTTPLQNVGTLRACTCKRAVTSSRRRHPRRQRPRPRPSLPWPSSPSWRS